MRSEIENMDANGMNWGVGPDTHCPAIFDKDVEGSTDSTTEQQMTTLAKPCFGYWAAYYINRDGGWSVACDALGRIIRCETEKLALSVARYRRRRLQPLQGRSTNPARVESRHGSDVTWSNGGLSTYYANTAKPAARKFDEMRDQQL